MKKNLSGKKERPPKILGREIFGEFKGCLTNKVSNGERKIAII
jgi:hypothetical protein